ncbi:FAD-binding domain-containing protein [Meredithblackwellia eburnea MCA 4105]
MRGQLQQPPSPDQALAELERAFPASKLSSDGRTLTKFGTSFGSFSPPTPPLVVVHAENTADVVTAVKIASKHNVVLIPVAGRTSLEGQFLPLNTPPPIHLSFDRMDKILAVHPQDFHAVVEPGVGWQSLNEHLQEMAIDLFFPIDPAPGACFGGMVGVGGSGTNAVGYGTMRAEWVMGMEVVLMSGEVIQTRGDSRSRKSSTGWDVGRLFLGSEGTLGIITKLAVRLAPIVPLTVALTSFATVSDAVRFVTTLLSSGVTPISLELLDGTSIRGLNMAQILPYELAEEPTVFVRLRKNAGETGEGREMGIVRRLIKDNRGHEPRVGMNEKENEKIWQARKAQYWSQQLLLGDGCQTYITDVCVPISRLADFIAQSEIDVKASGLLAPIVAHIGDGNVHRAILFVPPPGATAIPQPVIDLASKLSTLAISMEGTSAGEHGIGTTKRKYLQSELGEGTLSLMRAVKDLLDPKGLLNPGKVLFETEEEQKLFSVGVAKRLL